MALEGDTIKIPYLSLQKVQQKESKQQQINGLTLSDSWFSMSMKNSASFFYENRISLDTLDLKPSSHSFKSEDAKT
jgi:hypothetical protein